MDGLQDKRVIVVSNYLPYCIRKVTPSTSNHVPMRNADDWIDLVGTLEAESSLHIGGARRGNGFTFPQHKQKEISNMDGHATLQLRAPKTIDGFSLLDEENVSMAIPIPKSSGSRRGSVERVARSLEAISDASSGSLPQHPHDCSSPISEIRQSFATDCHYCHEDDDEFRAGEASLCHSFESLTEAMMETQLSPAPAPTPAAEWRVEAFYGGNVGLKNAILAGRDVYTDCLWIGGLASDAPPAITASFFSPLRERHRSVPITNHGTLTQEGHYNRFCKKIMWPIFHNMLPEHQLTSLEEDWEAFCQVNETFAQTIIAEYRPGDLIWINDYHLMLVPALVREAIPDAAIGFFLHVPFPTSEIFRCLSVREQILKGVLGADLIGFQTYGYARHFLQSCTRILGYECSPRGVNTPNRPVSIGIFPIGVDSRMIERHLSSPEVSQVTLQLRERYADIRIILGRDKLDPVKGIKQKLLGFEQFLLDHPEWRDRVMLMQVALPSASGDRHRVEIDKIVSRINSRFGSIGHTPVLILSKVFSFAQYLALLSVADVCLITSLRDGMNLTSHEFILAQHGNAGSLIISEFAGTSSTFEAAIRVNPWDPIDVSESIAEALEMDMEERHERHASLYKHVVSNTAQVWTRSFLEELCVQAQAEQLRQKQHASPLLPSDFIQSIHKNNMQSLVLILDYDALVPSFKEIYRFMDTLRMLKAALNDLVSLGIRIVLMSERSADQLEHTFQDLPQLILCAEEGFTIKHHGQWHQQMDEPDQHWWSKVEEILEFYHERTPGSWIERKHASIIWHYGRADAAFASRQAKECQAHVQDSFGSNYPVHAVAGWQKLEIKLRNIGKRSALASIIKLLKDQYLSAAESTGYANAGSEMTPCFFLKPNNTDGDIFSFVQELITTATTTSTGSTTTSTTSNESGESPVQETMIISIGKAGSSNATHYCSSPLEVIQLLARIAHN